MQTRFLFFARFIHRLINLFQLTACCVFDYLRPGFIRFAQRHRIGVTLPAVFAQGFVGFFGYVWATHDDRDTSGTNHIGHPIGLLDHPCHRPDPNQSDVLFLDIAHQLAVVQRLGVAVYQQHFMPWRRECLQQKHPEMRHEDSCHAVIRVVEQNSHKLAFPCWLQGPEQSPLSKDLVKPLKRRAQNSCSRNLIQISKRFAWTCGLYHKIRHRTHLNMVGASKTLYEIRVVGLRKLSPYTGPFPRLSEK